MNHNKVNTSRVTNMKRTRHAERGVAAVEFALVLPLLLLILFGIVEFSLALYDKAVITNASREAARAGVVAAVTPASKLSSTAIQGVATNYCSNYMISLGSGAKTCPAANINVTGAQGASGTQLSVTVSYTFSSLALGKMISPITGPLTMSATTVMINE